MSKVQPTITGPMRAMIEAQHVFFVATAPGGTDGHVNLSPKGLDTFRVLDERTVAYLDFIGSGVETIAHLRADGRIVLMFCAFEGAPKIVRLHGRGEAIEPGDARFDSLVTAFDATLGATRAIILVHVERVSDSCGYGVPRYDYVGERPQLRAWGDKRTDEDLLRYQREKNAVSIDGLPGLAWVGATDPSAGPSSRP